MTNAQLKLHVALELPPQETVEGGAPCAGLRVGGRVKHWSDVGDVVMFDDSFEHDAWNMCVRANRDLRTAS